MTRVLSLVALFRVAFQTPAIKPSQHGTVTQQVAGTTITVAPAYGPRR